MKPLIEDLIYDDICSELSIPELIHELQMSCIHKKVAEKMLLEKIESHLGFSLSDDDARQNLNQLSGIIEIPDILYQLLF